MKKFLTIALISLVCFSAQAGSIQTSATITAQNQFSPPISLGNKSGAVLTLTGTWVGTVTLQRQDISGTYVDVTDNTGTLIAFTKNGTYSVYEPTLKANYTFGVKTGNYTSGTINGVLEWN